MTEEQWRLHILKLLFIIASSAVDSQQNLTKQLRALDLPKVIADEERRLNS